MSKLQELKKRLRPGQVYRRADLSKWSNSVDRHLSQLVSDGVLVKVSPGLYSCPRKSVFGLVPADDYKLVKAFLKDEDFIVTTPNLYNSLGVGTTQLHNETVVYNRKRHGSFELGNRVFNFKRFYKRLPKKVTQEFLLVNLLDNLSSLGEDSETVLKNVHHKAREMNPKHLKKAVVSYGGVKAQKFLADAL